jgi:hypothetical protein
MPADRVDLIMKTMQGAFSCVLEQVPDARGADTDEQLDEIRTADREKGHAAGSPATALARASCRAG